MCFFNVCKFLFNILMYLIQHSIPITMQLCYIFCASVSLVLRRAQSRMYVDFSCIYMSLPLVIQSLYIDWLLGICSDHRIHDSLWQQCVSVKWSFNILFILDSIYCPGTYTEKKVYSCLCGDLLCWNHNFKLSQIMGFIYYYFWCV